MSGGFVCWLILLLWLVFGFWGNWPQPGPNRSWRPLGAPVLLFIVLAILTWHCYGPPIKP